MRSTTRVCIAGALALASALMASPFGANGTAHSRRASKAFLAAQESPYDAQLQTAEEAGLANPAQYSTMQSLAREQGATADSELFVLPDGSQQAGTVGHSAILVATTADSRASAPDSFPTLQVTPADDGSLAVRVFPPVKLPAPGSEAFTTYGQSHVVSPDGSVSNDSTDSQPGRRSVVVPIGGQADVAPTSLTQPGIRLASARPTPKAATFMQEVVGFCLFDAYEPTMGLYYVWWIRGNDAISCTLQGTALDTVAVYGWLHGGHVMSHADIQALTITPWGWMRTNETYYNCSANIPGDYYWTSQQASVLVPGTSGATEPLLLSTNTPQWWCW